MVSSFKGFPKDLFGFLSDLVANNNRDWFNQNKDRYRQSVVEPMSAFIEAMDPRLAKVSDCFVADPRPNGGSMFRIYRDVRFSKDKRPYKEHAACHFRHIAGKDAHAPGFYVHLAPDEVFFGGGIWHPPNSVLHDIREAITEDPQGWKRATRRKAFVDRFGGLAGETLKRPPQGFDPEHPYIEDLKRRDFFAMQQASSKLALSPRFVDEVEKAFVVLAPVMEFITHAVGVSFQLDD